MSAAHDLEIVDLRIDVIEREAPRVVVNDARGELGGPARQGVLRVRAASGVEGQCLLGMQAGDASAAIELLAEQIKPRVLGRLAREREWVWAQRGELDATAAEAHAAMAPLDVALWDLAGKELGVPVHALLGTRRSEIPVYATSPPRNDTPEGYEREAEEIRDAGLPAYKIHPGGMPPDEVRRTVALARDVVGGGMDLMLDPNAGYDLERALRVGAALDEQGFAWFEDPLPWADFDAIARLSADLETPIAIADAPAFLLGEAADYLRRGAPSVFRGTSRKLGITGLRTLCSMLEPFELNCEIGMGGNASLNAANLHVMLAIGNCDYYEYWMPLGMHEWGAAAYLRPNERGAVTPGDAPGLGVELDEAWIAAHRVAVVD